MKDIEIEKFFKAVQLDNLKLLKELLLVGGYCGININSICRKNSGDSLMHVVSRLGFMNSTTILEFLIKNQGGNIELANLDQKTPLHDATQFSNLSAVEYLINTGANVNAVKKGDWTPLMLACTKRNQIIVKLLLENKADPLFVNKDGWNSFHIAAREGCLEIIKQLLDCYNITSEKHEQLCHSPSKNGRRPIHTAVMHGQLEVAKLLLEEKCIQSNVDVPDQCGTTALMDACRFGHIDLIDLLIKYGADLHKLNRSGMNCLHIAAESGCSKIIQHLVMTYHMDVDCFSTPSRMTCLHWAVKEEHIDTLNTLLQLRASHELKATNGLTCLELAKKLGKIKAYEFLEKYFININFKI